MPEAFSLQRPLGHDESRIVNLQGEYVAGARQTKRDFGIEVPTVAKIEAGRQLFSVLDTRDSTAWASPLLVVDKSFDPSSRHGYKGIWQDQPLVFGRRYLTDRFDYDPTVSRDHFSIAYNGLDLVVKNLRPTNKTLLSGDLGVGLKDKHNVAAEFTHRALNDIKNRFDFGDKDGTAPEGYYKNHIIIGRNTNTVKDGVYFTTNPNSEAVVVDDKSRALQEVAQNMLVRVERKFGKQPTVNTELILKLVNDYTASVMSYDLKKTEKLSSPYYQNNGLICLSEYVAQGVGVCRHQCLLAAFLMETLAEEQIIMGRPGVERNHDIDAHGAHAWAVFKTPAGQTFVVDPAQHFVGTKEKARRQHRWKYDLPTDN